LALKGFEKNERKRKTCSERNSGGFFPPRVLYGTLFVNKGAGSKRCFLSRLLQVAPVKPFKTVAAVYMQKQREDGREQKRGREKKGEKLHQAEQIQAEQSAETGGKCDKFIFFHIHQAPFIRFTQSRSSVIYTASVLFYEQADAVCKI